MSPFWIFSVASFWKPLNSPPLQFSYLVCLEDRFSPDWVIWSLSANHRAPRLNTASYRHVRLAQWKPPTTTTSSTLWTLPPTQLWLVCLVLPHPAGYITDTIFFTSNSLNRRMQQIFHPLQQFGALMLTGCILGRIHAHTYSLTHMYTVTSTHWQTYRDIDR